MTRYKILLLLLAVYHVASEEEKKAEERILRPPDKLFLKKSTPYQQSFFSKIAGWLYPFGSEKSTDLVPAEGHYGGPQYLPPPNYQSHDPECNPCNEAPWIPVASNQGHNTVINFHPPSSHLEYGPPKPQSSNYIEDLRPPPFTRPAISFRPPVTYLKPVQDYGMRPPPVKGGIYYSLPDLPSPPPSDSYGSPVTGSDVDYQIKQEYLPPLEPLPLPDDGKNNYHQIRQEYSPPLEPRPLPDDGKNNYHQIKQEYLPPLEPLSLPDDGKSNYQVSLPIALPNLSVKPVLPIHNPQSFRSEVQVVPSIKVADFLSTIEHPISYIQSPLVEVSVKDEEGDLRPGGFYGEGRLSENPIVVEDTHTSASVANVTFSNATEVNHNLIQEILLKERNKTFTPPPLDYSKWQPSWRDSLQTAMVPPPLGATTWIYPTTTKKPKQIQIIVPYTSYPKKNPGSYTTLLPVYSPPMSTGESLWLKFMDDYKLAESKRVTATAFTPPTTQVYNIQDLLKDQKFQPSEKLPFDVISLQNNIDDWTQQQYAKSLKYDQKTSTTSKKIPQEYFTTQPYVETTTPNFDHLPESSDIDSNFLEETTTEKSTPRSFSKDFWDATSVSPLTKEKVYIVTPQPYNYRAKGNQTKFLVRVDPENPESRKELQDGQSPVTVVFSEWPHLINNLQTTTIKPQTSRHPLFGLMDLAAYTPPPNSTVQTISGHSKVVTVVTSATTRKPTQV